MPNLPAVLFVDDESLFLETVVEGFADRVADFTILTANNGREAVEILKRFPVNLVVTDLKMPEMDGFELLAFLSLHHPGIPVIVMTAFGSHDIEVNLGVQGVDRILNKPFSFKTLKENVEETLAMAASGHLTGIALATFLQMIQLDRKTCLVKVESEGSQGRLQFKAGELVNAQVGNQTGNQAALKILTWHNPTIEMLGNRVTLAPEPMTTLQELLLDAFRLLDEQHPNEGTTRAASPRETEASFEENPLELSASDDEKAVRPAPEKAAMNSFMRELHGIRGIKYAVVVSSNGALGEDKSPEAESLAAKSLFLCGMVGGQMGELLGLGELNSAAIRGAEEQLLVFKSKDRFFCISIEGSAPLDTVEHDVRKALSPKKSGG